MITILGTIGGALALSFLGLGALRSLVLLAFERRDYQRSIGYGYGSVDGHKAGEARGYTRGYSQACLDHVLAAPGGDDFTEALLSGALHEPVSEHMSALLAAVQEHERAAKAEAAS